MKLWVGAVGLIGVAAGFMRVAPAEEPYTVFVTGDANGYLSPCGCSFPMMGGAKRRATAIKGIGAGPRTIILENGGFVKFTGRQDEIKVETFAQLHEAMAGTAINLSYSEAKLGVGAVAALSRLSGNRLVSLSVPRIPAVDMPRWIVKGPFIVGGVSDQPDQVAGVLGEQGIPTSRAVGDLVAEARKTGLQPMLMVDGNREVAARLAKEFPELVLIQYKSFGHPPQKLEMLGKTALVTPGDGGKDLVRLIWRDGKFSTYASLELSPGYKDDPDAKRVYDVYLKRVSDEKLLEEFPRPDKGEFSGSKECIKCHAEAGKVWEHSKHAEALTTLEKEGHDRDPDCVECHVVGLASIYGFSSRAKTPDLAAVGCESCHGPGKAHSIAPKANPLPKIGEKQCMSCHKPENSPRFNFSTYWEKIKHK